MNDRYLYRAKRKKDGKWTTWNAVTGIHGLERIEDDTICQCTGLKDKNGKLIWENDIVKPYDTVTNENYIISWDKEMGAFVFCDINTNNSLYVLVGHYIESIQSVEVIGNIFDNPELLERGVE